MGIVNNEKYVFIVRGVFENIPENSTLRAQCFVNIKWTIDDLKKSGLANAEKSWRRNYWNTWILLSKDCNAKSLENQFRAFENKNIGEKTRQSLFTAKFV